MLPTPPDLTALLTDLAAQVATRHSTIPAVRDPAYQRHGPRRTDALHGPAHTRRITRSSRPPRSIRLSADCIMMPAASAFRISMYLIFAGIIFGSLTTYGVCLANFT